MSRYTEEELDELWEPTPRYTRCTCNSQSVQPCPYCEQEAEVHEAAALLEKSREVCEWELVENAHAFRPLDDVYYDGDHAEVQLTQPNYCPSCGRKVVVK